MKTLNQIQLLKGINIGMIKETSFCENTRTEENSIVTLGYNGTIIIFNINEPQYKKIFIQEGQISSWCFNNTYFVGNLNIDPTLSKFFIWNVKRSKLEFIELLDRADRVGSKDEIFIRSLTFLNDSEILITLLNKNNFTIKLERFFEENFSLEKFIANQTNFLNLGSACYNIKNITHLNSLLIRNETTMNFYNLNSNSNLLIKHKNISGSSNHSEVVKVIGDSIYCLSSKNGVNVFNYKDLVHTASHPIFNWGFIKEKDYSKLIADMTLNPNNNTALFLLKGSYDKNSYNSLIEWNYRRNELVKGRFASMFEKYKKLRRVRINSKYDKLLLADAKEVLLYEGDLNL